MCYIYIIHHYVLHYYLEMSFGKIDNADNQHSLLQSSVIHYISCDFMSHEIILVWLFGAQKNFFFQDS